MNRTKKLIDIVLKINKTREIITSQNKFTGPLWSWSYDSWILHLPMDIVPIATKVESSNSAHGEVNSLHHYVIKFVNDLWQESGFIQVLLFPPPIKLTPITLVEMTNQVCTTVLKFMWSKFSVIILPTLYINKSTIYFNNGKHAVLGKIEKYFSPKLMDYFIQGVRKNIPLWIKTPYTNHPQ